MSTSDQPFGVQYSVTADAFSSGRPGDEAEAYAIDPYWQGEMASRALAGLLLRLRTGQHVLASEGQWPLRPRNDLRGLVFSVEIAPDGMTATASAQVPQR